MRKKMNEIKQAVVELWHDDRGAEGLEKLLIVGAVALPLLAVLVYFSGTLREWVVAHWLDVNETQESENPMGSDPF